MTADPAKPLTAGRIAAGLMASRWRRNFVLPTYTPAKWWECDVFEVSKAGYFREYEVKVGRGDFFADARKAKTTWRLNDRPDADGVTRCAKVTLPSKHERLAAGDPLGPSRFWFVTPAGLLRPDDLPAWAGLIEMSPGRHRSHVLEREAKPAPRLHREKVQPAVLDHARSVCYWRMHALRLGLPVSGDPPARAGQPEEGQ